LIESELEKLKATLEFIKQQEQLLMQRLSEDPPFASFKNSEEKCHLKSESQTSSLINIEEHSDNSNDLIE